MAKLDFSVVIDKNRSTSCATKSLTWWLTIVRLVIGFEAGTD